MNLERVHTAHRLRDGGVETARIILASYSHHTRGHSGAHGTKCALGTACASSLNFPNARARMALFVYQDNYYSSITMSCSNAILPQHQG